MRRRRARPAPKTLLRLLHKAALQINKTHTDEGDPLYGSTVGETITLALQTCLRDGGPHLAVMTLVHELIHLHDFALPERDVEHLARSYERNYQLLYRCALAIIERLAEKI